MRLAQHWFAISILGGALVAGQSAQDSKAKSNGMAEGVALESELAPLLTNEVLICKDRKVASGAAIGLWHLNEEGEFRKIWDGEPFDALWLLDRTILVCERWSGRVTHLSREFKVLQSLDGFSEPVDVERTEAGHWVVLENGTGRVICVDPETGERRWIREGFRSPFDMAVLKDGGLLVADSGANRIVRLDAKGEIMSVVKGIRFPNTVDPTEDGGFLATDWSSGNVWRYGSNGRLKWRTGLGATLQSADERPDGRVVATDGYAGKVFYLDPKGQLERTESFQGGCVDGELILRL